MAANNTAGVTQVVLTIGKTDFKFKVGITAFSAFQNTFVPGHNVVAPSENFVMDCAINDQKEELAQLCDQGYAVELAQQLAGEFKPALEIKVKK